MESRQLIHQTWIFVVLSFLIGLTLGFVVGQSLSSNGATGEASFGRQSIRMTSIVRQPMTTSPLCEQVCTNFCVGPHGGVLSCTGEKDCSAICNDGENN